MSQVLIVQSYPGSHFVLKVYDPRFFSHHHNGHIKWPWSYNAEAGAAIPAQLNAHFDVERGASGSREGETGVYGGNQVRTVCGNQYLDMVSAIESEVAELHSSTATGAPL
jgi:hypothetical protein